MGKVFGKDGTPRGIGNQVSAEFNLVYRWHSAISERDDEWTQGMYRELFGKDAKEVSMQELLAGLSKWEHDLSKDPSERPFAHIQRGTDGKFSDDDLVKIMTESIEDTAGMYNRLFALQYTCHILSWILMCFNEFPINLSYVGSTPYPQDCHHCFLKDL